MASEADTREHLSALVEALERAFISTWQSTAAWQKELDAAREYLNRDEAGDLSWEAREKTIAAGVGTAPAPQRYRGATDEEVLAWAERHDLSCWDNLSEARAAFEDAETLHMTYGVPEVDAVGRELLAAGLRSGDAGAFGLAAQLAGVPACVGCGYRKEFCRCASGVGVAPHQTFSHQTPMPSDKDEPR